MMIPCKRWVGQCAETSEESWRFLGRYCKSRHGIPLGLMVLWACGNASPPSQPYVTSGWDDAEVFAKVVRDEPLDTLGHVRDRCERTAGRWIAGLLSCVCPKAHVFYASQGCIQPQALNQARRACPRHPAVARRQTLDACLNHAVALIAPRAQVILDGLSHREVMGLVHAVSEDPTRLLVGTTLPDDPRQAAPLRLMRPDANHAELMWNPWLQNAYSNPFFTVVDPTTLQIHALDPWQLEQHCRNSLEGVGQPKRSDAYRRLCATVRKLAAQIEEDRPAPGRWVSNFTQEGDRCVPQCAFVSNPLHAPSPGVYNVVMERFVANGRYILVEEPHEIQLFVFLSPLGGVQGMALVESEAAASDAPYVLIDKTFMWDSRWQLVVSTAFDAVPRKTLWAALKNIASAAQPLPMPMPMDEAYAPLDAKLHAVVMDSGTDIRWDALRARLLLNAEAARLAVDKGQILSSLFSYERDPISHIRDVTGAHGAAMAAQVVAGLPHARVASLRYEAALMQAPPEGLPQRWAAYIRHNHARVVNISQGWSRHVANCASVMGRLFQELPDVLFVVAMGNRGGHEPTGTCPANLASRYPNVLSVAGTDSSGKRIHAQSNYGARVASVAAPYVAPMLNTEASVSQGRSVVRMESGTSVSTALVSNAALRLFARDPHLSAFEAAKLVMQACNPDGLDVACGGAVNFNTLEAYRP